MRLICDAEFVSVSITSHDMHQHEFDLHFWQDLARRYSGVVNWNAFGL
jgi:hypothetical protein